MASAKFDGDADLPVSLEKLLLAMDEEDAAFAQILRDNIQATRLHRRDRGQPDGPSGPPAPRAHPACRLDRHLRRLGAEKPSPDFFKALIETCGLPPEQIAYVGDRHENDIHLALDARPHGRFHPPRPVGYQRTGTPATQSAHIGVATLAELPAQLAEYDNQDITGR